MYENVGKLSGRAWLDDNLMDTLSSPPPEATWVMGRRTRCLGTKSALYRANVPFLLRPDGDGYLLVGEAFVLGLLDGEYKDGFYEIEIH